MESRVELLTRIKPGPNLDLMWVGGSIRVFIWLYWHLLSIVAVTATKLNRMRAEKATLHCYNKAGGEEEETKDRIYDEVGEGTDPIRGQKGHYQELKLETME